jgi:hypothetical protein
VVSSHREAPFAQADLAKPYHVVMGEGVQGMDYLVALNPTFREVKTEVETCDQGTLGKSSNGHVWPQILNLTLLDSWSFNLQNIDNKMSPLFGIYGRQPTQLIIEI